MHLFPRRVAFGVVKPLGMQPVGSAVRNVKVCGTCGLFPRRAGRVGFGTGPCKKVGKAATPCGKMNYLCLDEHFKNSILWQDFTPVGSSSCSCASAA